MEELNFVPSAISDPQKMFPAIINQCKLASVVIREGDESYTTNICQKCYNDSLKAKRRKTTDKLAVETVRGSKGAPWKALENDGEKNNTYVECVNIFAEKEIE